MFSGTFDGEILNAAKAAERLVKSRGETWESVITMISSNQSKRSEPKPDPWRSSFQDETDACMKKTHLLTAWETEFLISISDRKTLSPKQQARFEQIKAKVASYSDMNF